MRGGRLACRDPPAGQREPADAPPLAHRSPADRLSAAGAERASGKGALLPELHTPSRAARHVQDARLPNRTHDSRSTFLVDEHRSARLLTPRKPGSNWSARNKARVEQLANDGRMHPAGLAAVVAAKANGAWTALDEAETLTEPADLAAALDATPGARRYWNAFPRSARRAILEWITNAKTSTTRQARIQRTAADAARNIRANQWRQPTGRRGWSHPAPRPRQNRSSLSTWRFSAITATIAGRQAAHENSEPRTTRRSPGTTRPAWSRPSGAGCHRGLGKAGSDRTPRSRESRGVRPAWLTPGRPANCPPARCPPAHPSIPGRA